VETEAKREAAPAVGSPASGPAIAVRRLWRLYGDLVALRDVSLTLALGETLVVLGPNGAGKTTLLRVLATLLRPGGGDVEVLGCKLPDESWRLRGMIGFLGHEPLLYRDLTPRENLRFHARLHGLGEGGEKRIASLLELVGIAADADRRVSELSAGMTQRVAICRAVLHEPELLLLDEPYSHLDADGLALVQPLIGRQRDLTRVLVSHDRERATAESDRVLELAEGVGSA
jgi:heme exporter protein A